MYFVQKSSNLFSNLPEYIERINGPGRDLFFENIENSFEFNFKLNRISRKPGVSAMLRVKNEEDNIDRCLRSIYDTFEEIMIVNNASTDSTAKKINRFKQEHDREDKCRLFNYPFPLSRVGPENAATDANSLHSLVYFSNWCLSKCSMSHVFKWDADMVLPKTAAPTLRTLLSGLNSYWPSYLQVPLQTLYVQDDETAYQAIYEVNQEHRVFPNRSDVHFVKHDHFELLQPHCLLKHGDTSGIAMFEVKDIRVDEFDHWSTLDFPTERKKQEWKNYNMVKNGELDSGFRRLSRAERDDLYFT